MGASFSRTLPADADALPGVIDTIEAWLADNGVAFGEAARMMIAFDEILSNIARHGGGTIDLSITLADGRFSAVIADDGPRFDPLARATPDTDLGIDDRDIGGLGIHLVREMMDEVGYVYADGRNRLSFGKTF